MGVGLNVAHTSTIAVILPCNHWRAEATEACKTLITVATELTGICWNVLGIYKKKLCSGLGDALGW